MSDVPRMWAVYIAIQQHSIRAAVTIELSERVVELGVELRGVSDVGGAEGQGASGTVRAMGIWLSKCGTNGASSSGRSPRATAPWAALSPLSQPPHFALPVGPRVTGPHNPLWLREECRFICNRQTASLASI